MSGDCFALFTRTLDTSETLVENVPWVDVFLLTPHIKKVVYGRCLYAN